MLPRILSITNMAIWVWFIFYFVVLKGKYLFLELNLRNFFLFYCFKGKISFFFWNLNLGNFFFLFVVLKGKCLFFGIEFGKFFFFGKKKNLFTKKKNVKKEIPGQYTKCRSVFSEPASDLHVLIDCFDTKIKVAPSGNRIISIRGNNGNTYTFEVEFSFPTSSAFYKAYHSQKRFVVKKKNLTAKLIYYAQLKNCSKWHTCQMYFSTNTKRPKSEQYHFHRHKLSSSRVIVQLLRLKVNLRNGLASIKSIKSSPIISIKSWAIWWRSIATNCWRLERSLNTNFNSLLSSQMTPFQHQRCHRLVAVWHNFCLSFFFMLFAIFGWHFHPLFFKLGNLGDTFDTFF